MVDQRSASTTPSVQQTASFTDPNQLASAASATTAGNNVITPVGAEDLDPSGAVLHEIQIVAATDPHAAAIMVARLQEVKPSLRALTAQNLRASWQEHILLNQKAAEALAEQQATEAPIVHTAGLPMSSAPSTTFDPPPYTAPEGAAPPVAPLAATAPAETPAAPAAETPAAAPTPPPAQTPPAPAAEAPAPAETPAAPPVKPPAAAEPAPAAAAEAAKPEGEAVQQASHEEVADDSKPVDEPRNWEDALAGAIEQLATKATDDPRSTEEAYQHVRLRLMHLANGDRDKALAPIPGLTPTEQAYWQSQFFALATLLDYQTVPDEQRRASAASEQLSEAVGKLGELSNLIVRNVTFCNKVYGFGDIDKPLENRFTPGQTIRLYAEIDNFRSESTERGYHTSLATSYEVLDQSGNRVEGGEFASVEDYCNRPRQDFYIEYTITMPKRIYASKYQLQLQIRDRLSGKIGKSMVEFEIKE
ncbi:hypothetical protein [Aeoliella mucimassa]|uniref:hypothetical protein n=1 Tax=Aeoliella mucimassa TaxID=2527972 RepID=UPI0018D3AF76|nr:hypothetical protein [Aeoliella mucimassa]